MHVRENVSAVWCMTPIMGFTSISVIVIPYSLSAVDKYYPYHIHISLSSYNGYELNSLLIYYQQSFIAQLVEHHTGIAEVMALDPVEASEFILGFLCNCFSCFITTKISFTSILYPQYIYMINLIYTRQCYLCPEYRENLVWEISLRWKSPSVWKFLF